MWTIYYDNDIIDGHTKEDWINAPESGVQVIALWEKPLWNQRRWTGVEDRFLWTGDDNYDPFDYGVNKTGTLLSDEAYFEIWEIASHGINRLEHGYGNS